MIIKWISFHCALRFNRHYITKIFFCWNIIRLSSLVFLESDVLLSKAISQTACCKCLWSMICWSLLGVHCPFTTRRSFISTNKKREIIIMSMPLASPLFFLIIPYVLLWEISVALKWLKCVSSQIGTYIYIIVNHFY